MLVAGLFTGTSTSVPRGPKCYFERLGSRCYIAHEDFKMCGVMRTTKHNALVGFTASVLFYLNQ